MAEVSLSSLAAKAKGPLIDLAGAIASNVSTDQLQQYASAVVNSADSGIKTAAQAAIGLIASNPTVALTVAGVATVGTGSYAIYKALSPTDAARLAKYQGPCTKGEYLVYDPLTDKQCVPLEYIPDLPSCKGLREGDTQLWGTYEGGILSGVLGTGQYWLHCGAPRNEDDVLTSAWTNAMKASQKQPVDPAVIAEVKAVETEAQKDNQTLIASNTQVIKQISQKAEEQIGSLQEQMQAALRRHYNAEQRIKEIGDSPEREGLEEQIDRKSQASIDILRLATEIDKIKNDAVQQEHDFANKAVQRQTDVVHKAETALSAISASRKTAILSQNKAGKKTVHLADGSSLSSPAPKLAAGPTPTAAAALNAANGHSLATQTAVQQQHLKQASDAAANAAQTGTSTVANNPTAVAAVSVSAGTPSTITNAVGDILKDEKKQNQEIVSETAKALEAKSITVRKLVLDAEQKLLANKLELDKMAALPGGRRTKGYQAKKKELAKANMLLQQQADAAVMNFIKESTGLTADAVLRQLKLQTVTEKKLAGLTKKSAVIISTATPAKVTRHAKGATLSKPRGAKRVVKKGRCPVGSRAKISKKTGKKYCRRVRK